MPFTPLFFIIFDNILFHDKPYGNNDRHIVLNTHFTETKNQLEPKATSR